MRQRKGPGGEWVAAKLASVRGSIDGLVIEGHAGTAQWTLSRSRYAAAGRFYSLH
jgi:hypothetical protein